MSTTPLFYIPRSKLRDLDFYLFSRLHPYAIASIGSSIFGGFFDTNYTPPYTKQHVLDYLLTLLTDYRSNYSPDVEDAYCYDENADRLDDFCVRDLRSRIFATTEFLSTLNPLDPVFILDTDDENQERLEKDPNYVYYWDLIDLAEKSWRSLK